MTKARDLASGNPAPSTVSTTELGYVDGVTSAIQTQIDTKLATATASSTYLTSATAASTYLTTATAGTTYQTKAANGLVLLNTTSFSAVSSQAVNTIFSATYDCYKVVLTITASSAAPAITFRVRSGTTDKTAADYYFGGWNNAIGGATSGQYRGNASTSWGMGDISSAQAARYFTIMDIANPFGATATKGSWQGHYGNGSDFWAYGVGAMIADSISYDGFNILASTGTITGKVVTYGYNI